MRQLQLLETPRAPHLFRPVHYLGSKLRLVSSIRSVVEAVQPAGPLCDLFAGTGTVALALSDKRPLIAVDIQEYSRVLCSALLSRPDTSTNVAAEVIDRARSHKATQLYDIVLPLIEYEDACIERSLKGDSEPLCDFIEHGSLAWYACTGAEDASPRLRRVLKEGWRGIRRAELADKRSLITRHFGGSYFSFRQAADLDALLNAAHELPSHLKDIGIAPILSTASEIVNTVGKHFAQPIRPRDADGRPKPHLLSRVTRDRRLAVFSTHSLFVERYNQLPYSDGCHTVIRGDFEDFLKTYSDEVAIFYADPPYTRDHYSRFYHVLETMCLWDEPAMSTSTGRLREGKTVSRGFYRLDRHQSPFCIKSQAPLAFQRMFEGIRRFRVPLVLSYSPYNASSNARPRLMHIDGIIQSAKQHFRNVDVSSVGSFAHSKLNLQERNAPVNWEAEVLIICLP